jgi:hypothetical protein
MLPMTATSVSIETATVDCSRASREPPISTTVSDRIHPIEPAFSLVQ